MVSWHLGLILQTWLIIVAIMCWQLVLTIHGDTKSILPVQVINGTIATSLLITVESPKMYICMWLHVYTKRYHFTAIYKQPERISLNNTRQIVGFRNRIIHAYDSLDDTLVWAIVVNHLPALKSEVKTLLENC